MTNQLTFRNTPLSTISLNNQIWLTSSELAKALQYSNTKAVTLIYNKHSDEFSSGMTEVFESSTSTNLLTRTRIFSLRGAHLVAMFARTPISKEFRKWILDILDREVGAAVIVKPEVTHTLTLTDDELCNLLWLWKVSKRMRDHIELAVPGLRYLKSEYVAPFVGMSNEYRRTIESAKEVLSRVTKDFSVNEALARRSNWRVLNDIR